MLASGEVFQVLQERISLQVPGGLGLAARGLGTRQEGRLQFYHQVMNSPGLHPCCLPLLCCLKSGVFRGPFVQEEMCLQWGQRPGEVHGALGGSICSLHRPSPFSFPSRVSASPVLDASSARVFLGL